MALFTVVGTFSISEYLSHSIGGGGANWFFLFVWGGGREGYGVYTSTKKHKMALITDHLPADLSPDASADLSEDMS